MILFFPYLAQANSKFCAVPPFLIAGTKPNVVIMLDNSGSMKNAMYAKSQKEPCDSDFKDFHSTTTYFGMFESDKTYEYNATIPVNTSAYMDDNQTGYSVTVDGNQTGAFMEANCTITEGEKCWDGNFLNFITTRRIDAARQVLIGGKTENRAGYNYYGDNASEWKIVGNNERSDRYICSKQKGVVSPYPENTKFQVYSPNEQGNNATYYLPYSKIVPLLFDERAIDILDEDKNIIGEFGQVTDLDHNSKTITFKNTFTAPVVVAGPLSYNGQDPATIRITNVTGSSFDIKVEEWDYLDGSHAKESLYYLVIEKGRHTLSNGKTVIANVLNVETTSKNQFTTETFSSSVASTPVVLTSIASENDTDTVVTRLKDISGSEFKITLQEQESNDGIHRQEVVNYIAIEQFVTSSFIVGIITNVTSWKSLPYTFDSFVATMQTFNGGDTAGVRRKGYKVRVEEEKSSDTETGHTGEDIGYIMITPPQYNVALIRDERPKGVIHDFSKKFRLGLTFYNYEKDGDIYNGEIGDGGTFILSIPTNPFIKNPDPNTRYRTIDTELGANNTDVIVDGIEHYPLVWGTTPLAENLVVVQNYFEQDDNFTYYGGNYTDFYKVDNNADPFYDSETNQKVRCRKSFVIIFTDGAPYKDQNIPDDLVDYDGDSNPKDGSSTEDTNDYTDDLDDVAYWGYWDKDKNTYRDLRSDLEGEQYLTVYTVGFAGNTVKQILKDTADNAGGKAYSAADGNELITALSDIAEDIRKKTSAGSSISVLSERAKSGAIINQAVFYPEKKINEYKVTWTGQINSYWFLNTYDAQNIREDNANSTFLDMGADNIIDFLINTQGQLSIDYYDANDTTGTIVDTNSDGSITQSDRIGSYTSLDEVHRIWESGEKLNTRQASDRTIYGVDANDTMRSFTSTNYTYFKDLFGTSDFPSCLGTGDTKYENLINYTIGADDDFSSITPSLPPCRNKHTSYTDIWKLGDIIYSSPKIAAYNNYSMLFTGSNDGMLHAFRIGKIMTSGLGENQLARVCDDNSNPCTTTDLGKEEWAFIPKNSMPYLKYMADPNYCHVYSVDLTPYLIEEDTDNNGIIDKRILIGGMRFGGACGCTETSGHTVDWCNDTITPDDCNASNPSSCLGLSTYFALDITDPQTPQYLWEFNDPKMGFTYSGPAYIKRGSNKYIMFLSGPTNYKGYAAQDLKVFILKLNSDYTINTTYKFDGAGTDTGFVKHSNFASYNQAFGGRLFTNGVDYNNDGDTDMVFFGVNQRNGNTWQGNVVGVTIDDDDPANWNFESVFNSAIEPVTVKIEHMDCFGMNYIYFGTGRWFFKTDEPGQNAQDHEKLYGVRIDECLHKGAKHCSINNAHSSNEICDHLDLDDTTQNLAWTVDEDLLTIGGGYFKERDITDPTVTDYDIVFFTTTQPTNDLCGFGGRSRVWAMNCATGGSIWTGCDNETTPSAPDGSMLLQLSGGNIEQFGTDKDTFANDGNRTTDWFTGIPPETATPFVPPTGGGFPPSGQLLLWLER